MEAKKDKKPGSDANIILGLNGVLHSGPECSQKPRDLSRVQVLSLVQSPFHRHIKPPGRPCNTDLTSKVDNPFESMKLENIKLATGSRASLAF